MKKPRLSTVILLVISIVLLILSLIVFFLSRSNGVRNILQNTINEKRAIIRKNNTQNEWDNYSDGFKELYNSMAPKEIEIDYSKPIPSFKEYYWIQYGTTEEEATDERFYELSNKDVANLTKADIKFLFGYLRYSNTGTRIKEPIYQEIVEYYGLKSLEELKILVELCADYSPEFSQLLYANESVEELQEMYNQGTIYEQFSKQPLEEVALKAMRYLPIWARDPNVDLTVEQTQKLLENVRSSETLIKILLPQVRRNAEKYNLELKNDSIQNKIKAQYIEKKFREMGILD